MFCTLTPFCIWQAVGDMANDPKQRDELTNYLEVATPLDRGHVVISSEPTIITSDNIQQLGVEAWLRQIRDKTPQLPTCEIRMQDVSYTAAGKPSSDARIQSLVSAFNITSSGSKPETKFFLKNINAIFKPGTMTLVLGPPGCGKTTLLKHLAGILHVKGKEELLGSVTYNGWKPDQVDFSSFAAYVEQSDNHLPTLTVKETFEFAHKCLVGNVDPNDPLAINEQHVVDVLISVLGLTECVDTILGNDMVRGVSGGQKRRVTLGEMLTGRAPLLLLDEFSNGLDASTAYDIAKVIRSMADILGKTVVMSMLQPPPELYDLFDNILVLDKGQVIYNGPRTELPAYFKSIGYVCPPRKDMADFLQEVTTHLGHRHFVPQPGHTVPLDSIASFAAQFHACLFNSELQVALGSPSLPHQHAPLLSARAPGYLKSLYIILVRAWVANARNIRFNRVRVIQALVMGAVYGTIFIDIGRNRDPTQERKLASTKLGLYFVCMTYKAFVTSSTVETGIACRAVLYKQATYCFFPISTYVLADFAVEALGNILPMLAFCVPLYFGAGLHTSFVSFALFFVVLYLFAVSYSFLFKFFTSIAPDVVSVKVLMMLLLIVQFVFSGYIVPEDTIPKAWLWFYWINPVAWAMRALIQVEYLSSTPYFDAPFGIFNIRLGDLMLVMNGFSTNPVYIGSGIAFLAGSAIMLVAATVLSYTHVRVATKHSHLSDNDNVADISNTNTILNAQQTNTMHVLPFTPVTLAFRDLSYIIEVGKGMAKTSRQLLKGIHGCFEPGTLTALMGSTGAGKTTLIDVIAGRKTVGKIDGAMFINGYPLDRKTFNRVSGYCEQTNVHEQTSTVREAFLFSAALRLPKDTTELERVGFVDGILEVLELNTKANVQYSTLTQGERKRVTIGVELLSNPSILFLDEPTTGLDSRAATIVMECIKRIAQSGRTVVCTIHQPSTVLFELFDMLLLLKTGGEMVYFGHLGSESSQLIDYFSQFEGLDPIRTNENPASYMLNCIGAGTGGAKVNVDFAVVYKASRLGMSNDATVDKWRQPNGADLRQLTSHEVSLGRQFCLLFRRQWMTYLRSPYFNLGRVMLILVIALVFGSCFYGKQLETSVDVISQASMLFFASVCLCFVWLVMTMAFTSGNRAVFYREHLSVMYSPLAHALSLALVEFVYCVGLATFNLAVFYWLNDLSGSTDAWLFYWLGLTVSLASLSYLGHVLIYITPSLQMAILASGAFGTLIFVLCGFMIDGHTMAKGWTWVYWISPYHYLLEIIIMAQYNDQSRLVLDMLTQKQIPINQVVVDFFNGAFSFDNIERDFAILAAIIAFFQLVLVRCMTNINHTSR
ncbi:Aste57867_23784 [Aphanomyces stellatus]|uniref:Aste57867_23784 protein n=1 Tax=Aphanomyces stellatus TaxID=120398 RepID=A0A485LQG8_9STRA|nr:hypothetical protein As57867_023711 [Aphanomyces stellatus]VFU00429.1 Aste57867_23784 [Aphanomyces stellatus]